MDEDLRSLITKALDAAVNGEDITQICVEYQIKRSDACKVDPNYYWELYCEDQFNQ